MSKEEKQAIEHFKKLATGERVFVDRKSVEIVLNLLEQKDNKIKELEADLYSANKIINDYIEERNKIKDKLRQVQDYNLNWKDEMVFKFVMEILEE